MIPVSTKIQIISPKPATADHNNADGLLTTKTHSARVWLPPTTTSRISPGQVKEVKGLPASIDEGIPKPLVANIAMPPAIAERALKIDTTTSDQYAVDLTCDCRTVVLDSLDTMSPPGFS